MKTTIAITAASAAICMAGCIQVKTESEIKPIHITMDVNLKIDKDLDNAFADENQQKAKGNFKAIREILERKAAGITNRALLAERDNATDDDRILIAEDNAKRMKRFKEIAKENNTTIEVVQKRYAAKMRAKIPVGVWLQDNSGKWYEKD